MAMFNKEQLEYMLDEVAKQSALPNKVQIIKALQCLISMYYLDEYLGGLLFMEEEPNAAIRAMFGGSSQ